jgi:starch phosphorylase
MSTVEADLKRVPDDLLWSFRNDGRRRLIQYARERLVRQLKGAGAPLTEIDDAANVLDPRALTMGLARRFTTYKRPNLLLHDPDRLARLLRSSDRPVQLILAGKAHPEDEPGKTLVKAWIEFVRRPEIRSRAVFLADYDMSLAERLVQGIDLWINTPRRPWEASGTSGMKVLVNGGINLSELDGWWAEAYRPEVGWALGDGREHGDDPAEDAREAEQLYRLLEEEVVPAFYDRDPRGIPKNWIERVRLSMAELTPRFSTNRMVREYVEGLYLPAAQSYRERTANGGRKAIMLCRWRRALNGHWRRLRFGGVSVREKAGCYVFTVQIHLGGLDPEHVRVQLYAEPLSGTRPEIHALQLEPDPPDGEFHSYRAHIPAVRPASDYTPRVVPFFKGACVPIEAHAIAWPG